MLPEPLLELALFTSEASLPHGDRSAPARAAGPGRFDSRWELRRGLGAREGWFGDDGLRRWTEEVPFAQRSAACTASPSASTAIA